jgi:hypothetical protein
MLDTYVELGQVGAGARNEPPKVMRLRMWCPRTKQQISRYTLYSTILI